MWSLFMHVAVMCCGVVMELKSKQSAPLKLLNSAKSILLYKYRCLLF